MPPRSTYYIDKDQERRRPMPFDQQGTAQGDLFDRSTGRGQSSPKVNPESQSFNTKLRPRANPPGEVDG